MKIEIDLMVSNARERVYFEISHRKNGQRILDFKLTPEQFTRALGNMNVPKIEAEYFPIDQHKKSR